MTSCSIEKKEIHTTVKVNESNYRDQGYELATFAGGCFWCVEAGFQEMPGVVAAVSGYTGGDLENPTYQNHQGHAEAVQVYFDPSVVSYAQLVDEFWLFIDPTDAGGQFGDRGQSYKTAVFVHDKTQRVIAEASKQKLIESDIYDGEIVTPVLDAKTFWEAEEYHQDYYKKSALHYKAYEVGSGRAAHKVQAKERADDLAYFEEEEEETVNNTIDLKYTKPSDDELKEMLTPLQYRVTQEDGTEPAFENEYWDNKEEGLYVDVVTGEPLFSSKDKYDSGTGWPSFTKPLSDDVIDFNTDYKLILPRTEVVSTSGDTHLGHVFDDGPKDAGGKRYCLNSASLKFIPKDELKSQGYGEYLSHFE